MCNSACGDLERPPSRNNMSICAIIELIVMAICGILCLEQLIRIFNSGADLGNAWILITVIIDFLIVVGLVLVLVGLFCATSASSIRSGVFCFCIGAIASVVLIIYYIVAGSDRLTFENFLYIVLLIFLSYILWIQSGHL